MDENEAINPPIGESLPNEFLTKVGCLAIQIFSQCLDNKPTLIFREKPCRFRILRDC
jgi:hypothetical protein